MTVRNSSGSECALCGADLGIPFTTKPQVTIIEGNDRPRVRVLRIEGQEIHRCEVPPLSDPKP
jgi:hypothetical protein